MNISEHLFDLTGKNAVVVGGAGGIGQELMTNIKLDRYDQVSITLLLIILVVSALDMLSGRLRLWRAAASRCATTPWMRETKTA